MRAATSCCRESSLILIRGGGGGGGGGGIKCLLAAAFTPLKAYPRVRGVRADCTADVGRHRAGAAAVPGLRDSSGTRGEEMERGARERDSSDGSKTVFL